VLEEFHGPYSSWVQLTPSGDTSGATDSAHIQAAWNACGADRGGAPVIYLPAGNWYINQPIKAGIQSPSGKATGVLGPIFLGHSRSDTIIHWVGPPPAGAGVASLSGMFLFNGITQMRFGRFTFDGNGVANFGYMDAWDNTANYFPTANRVEDFGVINLNRATGLSGSQNETLAMSLGPLGYGASELFCIRCYFNFQGNPFGTSSITVVGVMPYNFNALDLWFWDCQFIGMQDGLTNYTPASNYAGDFMCMRCAFQVSQHDMHIANTAPNYASRWNYASGALGHWRHWAAEPVGNIAIGLSIQSCTIMAPLAAAAVSISTPGPIGLIDSLVGAHGSGDGYCIMDGSPYGTDNGSGEIWGIGNTFADPFESAYKAADAVTHVHTLDDTFSATVVDPGFPAMAAEPAAVSRTIREPLALTGAAIQTAINACGNTDVVHIPYGTYSVSSTIQVPANLAIFIEGDGPLTRLDWTGGDQGFPPVFNFNFPSLALIRDMTITGQGGRAIPIAGSGPSSGGVIHMEHCTTSTVCVVGGVRAADMGATRVDILSSNLSVNETVSTSYACSSEGTSVVHWVTGSTGNGIGPLYRVLGGGTLVALNVYAENGSRVTTVVAPNCNGTLHVEGGRLIGETLVLDLSSFTGTPTIANINLASGQSGGSAPNTVNLGNNCLFLGAQFPRGGVPYSIAGATQYAVLDCRQNDFGSGTSFQMAETSSGVSNMDQYLRDHLAAMRAAKPVDLVSSVPSGNTQLQILNIRTDGEYVAYNFSTTGGTPPTPPDQHLTGTVLAKATITGSTGGTTSGHRKALYLMGMWQQSTTANIDFPMVSSSDHISPRLGASPSVTLSKAGGSFAAAGGTVSEVGNGWYTFHATITDTNTLGDLAIHVTATAADPTDLKEQIVAFDPTNPNLGGNAGPFTFNWRGAYNIATAYVAGDAVEFFGREYVCTRAITGGLPSDITHWSELENGESVVRITISPSSWLAYPGGTQQLSAIGLFADNTTHDLTSLVNWASSNTGAATVSASGLYTGIALGSTNITASVQGLTSNTLATTVAHSMLFDDFTDGVLDGWNLETVNGGTVSIASGATPNGDGKYLTTSVPAGVATAAINQVGSYPVTSNKWRVKTLLRLVAWNSTGSANQVLQIAGGIGAVEFYEFGSPGGWTLGATAADGSFISTAPTTQSYTIGQWYLIELLADWSSGHAVYTLYVNGVLDETLTDSTTGTPWVPVAIRIGQDVNPSFPVGSGQQVDYDYVLLTDGPANYIRFADGFASNDFSKWTTFFNTGGSGSVIAATAPDGDGHFFRSISDGTLNSSARVVSPDLVMPTMKFHASFQMRVHTLDFSATSVTIFSVDNVGYTKGLGLIVLPSGLTLYVNAKDGSAIAQLCTTTSYALDTWYALDMIADWSGTNPVYRLYVNGVLDATITDTTTGTVWAPANVVAGIFVSAPTTAIQIDYDAINILDV
jgi:hypothetical protein